MKITVCAKWSTVNVEVEIPEDEIAELLGLVGDDGKVLRKLAHYADTLERRRIDREAEQ